MAEPVSLESYKIGCPDVLEVHFRSQPGRDCLAVIDLDGRINLGPLGRPLVEGMTVNQAISSIAKHGKLTSEDVDVVVKECRAARVYLCGPEAQLRRIVPYIGPERVLDFLNRHGALTPGKTDIRDVTVLRSRVSDGEPPQAIVLDWTAVLLGQMDTNVTLLPSDEVIVGETRRSSFTRMLPQWAVPGYRRFLRFVPALGWRGWWK